MFQKNVYAVLVLRLCHVQAAAALILTDSHQASPPLGAVRQGRTSRQATNPGWYSEKTSERRGAVLSRALIALLCRRHLSKVRTGVRRSRSSSSRCIYGCAIVRCLCCLRHPYRVMPRGLYTANTVATSNTSSASAAWSMGDAFRTTPRSALGSAATPAM